MVIFQDSFMKGKETIDVLIVGAGAAGLAAWKELHSANLKAVLLEGRDRIGGRVWTDRSSDWPIELGAEFVHGKPPAIWLILEQARLKVVETSGLQMVAEKGGLQVCQKYWQIIQKIDEKIDLARDVPYSRFLAQTRASRFEKRMARNYVEGFNAARAELISTRAIAIADRAASEIEGPRQFRIAAGYGSLTDWLAADLPGQALHLQTVVREISWQKGRTVITGDAPDGAQTFSAARALISAPLGVLKAEPGSLGAIRFIPPLSQKAAALKHLEVGHAVKLMITFRERFWRDYPRLGFSISFQEDVPVWWTQEPNPVNVLTGWAGGPAAEKLVNLSRQEVANRAIGSLSRTFGKSEQSLRRNVLAMHYHNWSRDPFSRGAYSYPKVGGLEAAQILAEPVASTLFFAGEATDSNGAYGTVHSALQSGASAARQIIDSFR